MKKVNVVLVAVLLASSMFAGCQKPTVIPSQSKSTEEVLSSIKGETISILFGGSTDSSGAKAVIAGAEKKLGITVELEFTPTDGHEDVIKTRLATHDMNDIFLNNPGAQMMALNPEETMAPLTKEAFASKLDAAFKASASSKGELYGIPQGSSMAGGILYNKKVYTELGLKIPLTWKDFLANCKVVKNAGKTAIIGSFKDTWTAQIIFLADYYSVKSSSPDFAANFTANKAKFETTASALRSWEKLYESKEYMNADYLATSYDVALEMLVTGKGAHYPMLTAVVLPLAKTYPDQVKDIGVFPIPSDDAKVNGLTVWPSATLHIYKGSKKIEACKAFFDFYLSDEGQSILMGAMAPSGPSHVIGVKLPANVLPFVNDMVPYFEKGAVTSALEFSTPVKGANCPQICVECGSQTVTAKAAAKLYDDDCVKQAVQLGLEGW